MQCRAVSVLGKRRKQVRKKPTKATKQTKTSQSYSVRYTERLDSARIPTVREMPETNTQANSYPRRNNGGRQRDATATGFYAKKPTVAIPLQIAAEGTKARSFIVSRQKEQPNRMAA